MPEKGNSGGPATIKKKKKKKKKMGGGLRVEADGDSVWSRGPEDAVICLVNAYNWRVNPWLLRAYRSTCARASM